MRLLPPKRTNLQNYAQLNKNDMSLKYICRRALCFPLKTVKYTLNKRLNQSMVSKRLACQFSLKEK